MDTQPLGNDTFGGRQYELKNVGQVAGLGTDTNDLHVPEAWGLVSVSPNIVVAVIDDGVDLTHPDLNLVQGYDHDGTVGGGPKSASDNHGTACAGNVGAVYSFPLRGGPGGSCGHYGGNGKTYMNVGLALGEEMVKLFKTDGK